MFRRLRSLFRTSVISTGPGAKATLQLLALGMGVSSQNVGSVQTNTNSLCELEFLLCGPWTL